MSEEQGFQEIGADETGVTVDIDTGLCSTDEDRSAFGDELDGEDSNDSDSDSGNEATAEVHDEIMRRLQDDDIDLSTFDQRQEFLRRYDPYLNPHKTRRSVPTLLHKIALNCDTERAAALVRLLVKEHPDLMGYQDKDEKGRTAMHVAILRRRSRLVTAMAEAVEEIDKFLGIQDDDDWNCLHAALRTKLPHQLVVSLVQRASERTLCGQDQRGLTPLHIAVSYDLCTASQLEVIRGLLKRGAPALGMLTDPPEAFSPYQYHVFTRRRKEFIARKTELPHRTIVTSESADQIEGELKLGVLRTMTEEQAKRILYGHNPDNVHISFDYNELPRKMAWNEFVKQFGRDARSGLRFDRVLQYVTFPRVEVILKGRRADLERDAGVRLVGPLGRKDMQFFFEWLYDKGVRHIIRVSVEDSGELGEKVHSDRVIQQSLERFVVEHLDWKKTDLDPETILCVSSKVEKKVPTPGDPTKFKIETVPDRQLRQLYLRWSGSNAVLRGWSEPGSLTMLPHLKQIVLVATPADKMYDNPEWIDSKVKDFEVRLNATRQGPRARAQKQLKLEPGTPDLDSGFDHIFVTLTDSKSEVPHEATSAPVKGLNTHRWLDSTARFAAEMIPFWETTVKGFLMSRQNRPTLEGLEDDVVLALIDDGVDMFDTPHTGQILEGKSFDFHDGKARPPFLSATGHGTVLASMILRVCPMVKVYPIRLKTYENDEGTKREIDAGYAAEAIQAALDKEATIICMAWTIPIDQGELEAQKQLHFALQRAIDRRVLMFCSVSNEGRFAERDYPSGPWSDRFFRIGTANVDGTVLKWQEEDGITYVLPGVDVIREQAVDTTHNGNRSSIPNSIVEFQDTGSSIATALAAGLAAMVIYCIKTSILAAKTVNAVNGPLSVAPPDNAVQLIAHPDEMKRAFASLGRVTADKFLQVWEELDKITEVLEAFRAPKSTPEVKLKSVEAFVDFGLKLWNAAGSWQED